MAMKCVLKGIIANIMLLTVLQDTCGVLLNSIPVPHTAKIGHKITSLKYLGQKFNVMDNEQFNNISKFFTTLPNGWIITNSDISNLLGKTCTFLVNNQLGSVSWQDTIHIDVKNGHSMFLFVSQVYEGHVLENQPPNTVVQDLENIFVRTDPTFQKHVLYTIVSGPTDTFKLIINADDSVSIVTLKYLNREVKDNYVLKVKAWKDIPYLEYTYAEINIFIEDENDNVPFFEKIYYYTSISDDIPALSTIFYVQAIDPDIGKLTYSSDPISPVFTVDPDLGHIILKSRTKLLSPNYDLQIYATDPDGQRSNATRLHISVDGVLRFSPEKHSRSKRNTKPVKEVEIPESYMGNLLDIQNGPYERFHLKDPAPKMLEINRVSGTLRLKDGYKLDYETQPEIEFTVVLTKSNDASYREEQRVRIKLTDVNDEFPHFINQPLPFLATVSQNAGPGTSVYQLMARDDDQSSDIVYNLESGGEDRFEVDPHTGVVRTKGKQQFKFAREYEIGVSASDASATQQLQKSPTHSLKILVGPRAPQFFEPLYEADVSENATPGHVIVHIKAYSFQGFPVRYDFATSEGTTEQSFAIHPSLGVVDLLRKLDYETDPNQYHLKVRAVETGQVERTSTVNLIINLIDENDNSPTFPLSQYIVRGLAETVAIGTHIIQVTATDLDSVTNAQLTYTVTDANFTVQSSNNIGYIKTARRLDYDYIPDHTYNFTVIATDNGSPPRNGSATVRVGVTNINDESPVFSQSIEHVLVSEDARNTMVHVVQAYDPDGDDVTYTFHDGRMQEGPFRINPKSGIISLHGGIDRRWTSYKLNITATDDGRCCSGSTSRSSRGQVIIEIKDINNNAPFFPDCSSYAPQVNERRSVDTPVIKVTARDPDRGANGNISYSVVKSGDQSSEYFSIDRITGQVRTADMFDRESKTGVTDLGLTIKAEDQGSPSLAGFCTFRVKIGDINDNPPVFDLPSYSTSIEESSIIGKNVLQVYATDRDAGENGQVEYSITSDQTGFFRIDRVTGWIKVAKAMTGYSAVKLVVRAKDKGHRSIFKEVDVHISITQTVNAYPQWVEDYSDQIIMLSENAPRDYIVKRLKAISTVQDSPFVNYVIQAGETPEQNGPPESFHSRIDESTNEMLLMVYKALDYEIVNTYTLNIKAANRATNSIHNDTRLTIQLIDENDEIPMFEGLDENGRYSGTVPENSAAGTHVIRVTATDRDALADYSKVTYRLKAIYDFEMFSVDHETGQVSTTKEFDREKKSEYYIMVVAEDSAKSDRPNHYPPGTPNQGEVEVQIRITDKNDERPYFKNKLYTASVRENADPDSVIITVTAEDKDEENTLSYSITHGNIGNAFEVDSALGKIKVRGALDYEMGPKQYRLTYRVFDDKFDNTTIVIIHVTDVNDNPPKFQSSVYNFTNLVEEEEGISESNPKYLLTVRADDPDSNRDSNIRYSLNGQFHKDGTFKIDPITGDIYLTHALDRDKPRGRPIWNFNVLAQDEPGLDSSLTGYAEVRIMPHDINDNAPEFSENFLVGRVSEHSKKGYSVLTVIAEDRDAGNNGSVTYSLKQVPMKGNMPMFTIDRDSGLITTTMTDALDREVKDMYDTVIVQAKDKGPNQRSSSATVTIYVEDVNDHAPEFTQKVYRTTMSENLALEASITSVSATDKDIGINAKLTYTLKEQDRTFFSMTSVKATNTGVLRVFKQPDFDQLQNPTYNLTVYVTDPDENHRDVAYIEVNITDYNDNPPVFVPNVESVTIFENVTLSTSLARFAATDKDMGLNRQFTYSIDRQTDPDRQYHVDGNGLVTVDSHLDREGERGPTHRIHILATDKGNPPQTGTGTLMVTLLDINDNPPEFAEDYRPVIKENEVAGKIVVNISAIDKDTLANGPPFEFRLPCNGNCPCRQNPTCGAFDFTFEKGGGKKYYGLGIVRSMKVFDREKQKEYHMPIVMTDSGKPPVSGTSTLTIVIGDINDNPPYPGHKDIFVYNYKGEFTDMFLGTVYVEDADDWDIADKTFTFFEGPFTNFRLNTDTGELYTRGKINEGDYFFTVKVFDQHWGKNVLSTVTVHIQAIGDDAVYSSGSLRLEDITAEEFSYRPKVGNGMLDYGRSKYDLFREKLAEKLGIPTPNVDIFTVMNHPTLHRTIDIRFAAHNSPYYKPARLDGVISQNMDEFARDLKLKIAMVPIDECLKEKCESGGCSNELITTGEPLVINTNGSSLIGVTAYIVAECKCAAREFTTNKTVCGHPNACLNGGRCIQRELDFICDCPHGFDGPRCQQTHHSFKGHGWAWYKPLSQCEDSHTSLEFMTTKFSGVLFYNGPIRTMNYDEATDYILLELKHGFPQLRINHGSGDARLTVDGKDTNGLRQLNQLNDGQWHRIDIFRNGKTVKMVVDKCKNSIIQENENAQHSSEDRRHCESIGETPGLNKYINVNTPLQLGGIADHTLSQPKNLPKHTFVGCMKNFIHNGELYDLNIGRVGNHLHSEDGCPAEDLKCKLYELSGPVCGFNSTCIANLNDDNVECQCKSGWRGSKCSIPTTTKDFRKDSYIEWDFKEKFYEENVDVNLRHLSNLHLMFRTRQSSGMLFIAQNAHKSEYMLLEVEEMRVQFRYNLGHGEQNLALSYVNVSDGNWHTVEVERVGHWVTLILDHGEGRQFNYTVGEPGGHSEIRVSQRSIFAGGDVRFSASSSIVLVDDDYKESCMNDIRYNGEWLPMDKSQNTESDAAEVQRSANLDDSCESNACDGIYCTYPLQCRDLWRYAECRCPVGQQFHPGGEICVNINECLSFPCLRGKCVDTPHGYYCDCKGDLCGAAKTADSTFVDLSMGAILAIIICALVLILVILIFVIYSRRRRPDSYVTGVDPDDDVRENIIHYDEEGVGEEDQDAYDINRLKKPMQESPPMRKAIPPPVAIKPTKRAPMQHTGPPPPIKDFIKNRQNDVDSDPNAPPHDSVREYAYEGGGSDAGSLSSLASTTDPDDQDFDYLANWGPRFNKLANMYGGPPRH